MGLRDLLAFLTSLPLGGGSLEGAARSIHLAPLAGLVVGIAVTAPYLLLLQTALPSVAAATAIASHLIATGGLHLDGFADYSEALLARARGEAAERILRDPRRGGMALAAVSTLVAARLGLLISEPHPALVASSYVAAGWSLHLYLALHPEPSEAGRRRLGEFFRAHAGGLRKMLVSTILALALATGLSLLSGNPMVLTAMIAAPVTAFLVSRDSASRLGRASGDAAGLVYEVTQVIVLATAIVITR